MIERPILMSGEMVCASMRKVDPKTHTRRVAKALLGNPKAEYRVRESDGEVEMREGKGAWGIMARRTVCPYGKTGDRLWVRETFAAYIPDYSPNDEYEEAEGRLDRAFNSYSIVYAADKKNFPDRWRPAIYMPRWASRLILEIAKVKIERVQDISEADAKAEGVEPWSMTQQDIDDCQISDESPDMKELARLLGPGSFSHKFTYQMPWDELNKERGFGWAKNPWVWVIEYRRVMPA